VTPAHVLTHWFLATGHWPNAGMASPPLYDIHIAHCLFVWIFLLIMRRESQINYGVWKSSFQDQSEENSVWILKYTTLFGRFCKATFMPAIASWYQVLVLNADAHIPISAARLCYFRCHWCRNITVVNCIVHWIVLTLSTLEMVLHLW